jgi:predicted HicB family RNase H-like nuclease
MGKAQRKPPRKPGRPPADKPLKMKCVRVTDDDWATWQLAADAQSVSLSDWIRHALNRAAKRARPSSPAKP